MQAEPTTWVGLTQVLDAFMNRPSNSQIERHYFAQFMSEYPLPAGDLVYTDKPDVIIRGADTLGIEITNLYIIPGANPTSEQVQRCRREQALRQAQASYLALGGKKFELSVDFHPGKSILETLPIARAICGLASQLSNASTGLVSPALFEHIAPLRFVYLNSVEHPDAEWRSVQSYSVPDLSVERVREVVAEKTAKLAEYQPCDRFWLLMVVDSMDPAQDQSLTWPTGANLTGSPYEKVLLYDPQHRQVLEIPY